MPKLATVTKRLVLGLPFRSDELHGTLLRKRIALPVFASDALSSVAYAPQEVLITLSLAGLGAYALSPWVGVAVMVVLGTVIVSYRQNVHAYPSGGGDYEIATVNLGRYAGLVVASALLVDYTLTVAVSVSAAADNLGALIPFVGDHKVLFACAAILVLTSINLRGVRESGITFAIPTYCFVVCVGGMIVWGLVQLVLGETLVAPSAGFGVRPEGGAESTEDLSQLVLVFLVLRSFTQGCAALTGVEAISNGVPAFRKPKSRNAATTLALLGLIAVFLFSGMIYLARASGVIMAERPGEQLVGAPPGYRQETLVAQLGRAVFDGFPPGFWAVTIFTALILVLAANTAFNGFPVLGSILAQDRYLPRQLHTRGDRLAFSNGILFLAFFAIVLVVGFRAEVTALIPLYTVGVFVSFTLSQTGMVRHWTRLLRTEPDAGERARLRRSRWVSGFGTAMTGTVLVVVLVTKFVVGAWIALVAGTLAFLMMVSIRRHYDRVSEEIAAPEVMSSTLPSRNHAIVLVSRLHMPTLRAVAYARATRPDVLEALTVNVDDADTRALVAEWEKRDIPVPLKVVESPYREITKPILQYVKRIRTDNPRDVVTVFIPEYVLGRWWEQLLHNQSALRLKGRLLFQPGVMVVSVPWQLESSKRAATRRPPGAPGSARRGYEPPPGTTPGTGPTAPAPPPNPAAAPAPTSRTPARPR
ncbi:APC family permease [Actinomycetospora cinnamomea]|uniref:Amino acid/polyamine/organocation transporter (APC superfamily) n=1 Tax=Actinomycetospora cinnamomea TaxID=663609 RepID=A0A2U1FQ24_9PSEU|nr:APC family permease [Actinomycetospora cinnamomea]PVZ14254.1 amino acid/polyamine/organocation transporter (APC superfamily) [Actinomycetospora cinnamomea]